MKKLLSGCLMVWSLFLAAQKDKTAMLMLKESPDGVYILLGNQRISQTDIMGDNIAGAIIYRAVGNEKFKEIGQLKPAASPAEFKSILGGNALITIAEWKKLKNEAEAWDYVLAHPKLNDYGLLAMNIKLGVAMGAYFLDKEVAAMKVSDVKYQVRYIKKDGKMAEPIETSIRLGLPASIPAPNFLSKTELDSFTVVKWYLPARTASDAVFANVFRSIGNSNKYELAGKIFANINQPKADSVLFKWEEKIKKGYSYNYFIQPTTMALLPGANSDTVNVVGADFSALQQISHLKAKDTAQGIFLSWTALPNSTIYSGLVIERSSQSVGPFVVVDTIPSVAGSYLDTKIRSNQSYFYRVYAVTIRGVKLPPSDNATGTHSQNNIPPDAPRNLTITGSAKGRLLKWNKNIEADVAGYYIFRSSTTESPELISLLVKDTAFLDTATLYGRNTYYYEVKAYNHNNISGENSNRVSYQPENKELPRTPTGIKGYAEVQRATISWDDVMLLDKFITGYNVYRKEGKAGFSKEDNTNADLSKAGFRKMNTQPLSVSTYTDVTASAGAYCVTATDVFGNESFATDAILLSPLTATFMPPSNVTARKVSKGIEVDWDKSQQTGVKQYIIFRRAANEAQALKIGTVDASKEFFTDTTVKAGVTYYYSVVISGDNAASDKSLEAGVAY